MNAGGLNRRAFRLVEAMASDAGRLGLRSLEVEGGGRVLDCGVKAPGGLECGRGLARVTLADLATVALRPGDLGGVPCPFVDVSTDHPVAGCMASQYAGWQISVGDFFAMGSGPFRALYGKEELFDDIGYREEDDLAVGVLETRALPGPDVLGHLSEKLGVERRSITLLVAPTASLAGSFQVVSRSVETALHKLHALGFDLARIVAGAGTAPLPPPAGDDLETLGRTNDAVLYGARVNLWARGDDRSLEETVREVPSSRSRDYGRPFIEVFRGYDNDFYKVDPLLFSPAEIMVSNIETGRSHHFGGRNIDVLRKSFQPA